MFSIPGLKRPSSSTANPAAAHAADGAAPTKRFKSPLMRPPAAAPSAAPPPPAAAPTGKENLEPQAGDEAAADAEKMADTTDTSQAAAPAKPAAPRLKGTFRPPGIVKPSSAALGAPGAAAGPAIGAPAARAGQQEATAGPSQVFAVLHTKVCAKRMGSNT